MAERPPAQRPQLPRILQWNCNGLRTRHAELREHLLRQDFDVLALQEVNAVAEDLRLPGFLGYSGVFTCPLNSCRNSPCFVQGHHIERPWTAIYVQSSLQHAVVPVTAIVTGPLECSAITIRLGGVDTTVASVYVRLRLSWDASRAKQLFQHLGKRSIICGDFNAHHPDWGSRYKTRRGEELAELIADTGLHLLNTGESTYIRRGTSINTATDLTLTSFESHYTWTKSPDTWGSDHFPIVASPQPRRQPRMRTYMVTDWVKFRRLCAEVDDGEGFLESIAACAKAATVECSVKPNTPAPDLCLLNLQASRRQAERRGLRTLKAAHWTIFRCLDACCRRRARRAYLASIGLAVSAHKTEALLMSPQIAARWYRCTS